MTIIAHKLTTEEKTILTMLSEHVGDLEAIYNDMDLSLRNKDVSPLLKRTKDRLDRIRKRQRAFEKNLVVNGKAL